MRPELLLLVAVLAETETTAASAPAFPAAFPPAQREAFARDVAAALLQVGGGAPVRGADEDAKARAQCDRYFNNYALKCTGGQGGPER